MNPLVEKTLQTQKTLAYLPLRITLGVIFMAHGAQKLFGWFGGYGLEQSAGFFESKLGMAPGILWAGLAGGGEFFGGLLVLLGLATRFGALNLVICMLVAIFSVHNSHFFLPDGMEYCVALLGGSLTLLVGGAGCASVDAWLTCKNKSCCCGSKESCSDKE